MIMHKEGTVEVAIGREFHTNFIVSYITIASFYD